MTAPSVGILGIGVHLPPLVRTNDWWPADVVGRWREQLARGMEALRRAPRPESAGAARVVDAMLELGGDPFEGVVERRILAEDQTSTDMEVAAATSAFANAGLAPRDVDLLLVHTTVPEYLLSNTACVLHRALGLPTECLALEVQAAAYSFVAQLAVAIPMIESGRIRHALLVQSCAVSRVMDPTDRISAKVGDAASAVLVGRVDGPGVLASVHRADGTYPRALIATSPGGRWFEGRSLLSSADPVGAQRVFLDTIDRGKEVVDAALAEARHQPGDVDFFAVHQGTPWLRQLVQAHVGLTRARSTDLFSRIAYVFAPSIPLVLDAAARVGSLRDGNLVVMLGGGTGMTCGATVMRWGSSPR